MMRINGKIKTLFTGIGIGFLFIITCLISWGCNRERETERDNDSCPCKRTPVTKTVECDCLQDVETPTPECDCEGNSKT